jgi:hypothetical protein
VLVVVYVVLGLFGMGIAALGVWFGDPCSPFCASVDDSPYTGFADTVMAGFGLLYLAGGAPLLTWRRRKAAWLVPLAMFLVTTTGAIAALLAFAPAGTFCDCETRS